MHGIFSGDLFLRIATSTVLVVELFTIISTPFVSLYCFPLVPMTPGFLVTLVTNTWPFPPKMLKRQNDHEESGGNLKLVTYLVTTEEIYLNSLPLAPPFGTSCENLKIISFIEHEVNHRKVEKSDGI